MTDSSSPRPRRRLAVLTCMDARIDVLGAFGLALGDAHILRNAGGRVTDDALRSLALSTNVLGVEDLVVMQHTDCGLLGVTDEELRTRTGADIDFLPIDDHATTLRADVDVLAAAPYLGVVRTVRACLYDVRDGSVTELHRWERS